MRPHLEPPGPYVWPGRVRAIVSCLVLFHLLAVVAEPLHFFSRSPVRGTSYAFRPLRAMLAPYIEFSYLNHGYFFFAPEPGPSHLMQCRLTMPDGKQVSMRYPDKHAQWPRLLYHRHFMLAEFLNQLHVPPVDAKAMQDLPTQEAQAWANDRQRFEMVRQSMQSHLSRRYTASEATIERMRHILPGSDQVLEQKIRLDDPSLYIVLPDTLLQPEPTSSGFPPLLLRSRSSGESVEVTP